MTHIRTQYWHKSVHPYSFIIDDCALYHGDFDEHLPARLECNAVADEEYTMHIEVVRVFVLFDGDWVPFDGYDKDEVEEILRENREIEL